MTRTYTTCPESYDGFGTCTVRVAGTDGRGKKIRLVETPEQHVEWQRQRYYSGGIYMAVDEPEFAKLVTYGIVEIAA